MLSTIVSAIIIGSLLFVGIMWIGTTLKEVAELINDGMKYFGYKAVELQIVFAKQQIREAKQKHEEFVETHAPPKPDWYEETPAEYKDVDLSPLKPATSPSSH